MASSPDVHDIEHMKFQQNLIDRKVKVSILNIPLFISVIAE